MGSNKKEEAASPAGGRAEKATGSNISARDKTATGKPTRDSLSGPRNAKVFLRVMIERSAYAELIAYAKESLEAEVCGVLAGKICEDDDGLFVHVQAVVRGSAANHGSTHVTFTQATWTTIHQTLERDYPNFRMVGWYHTHPGFGVEFSEMDLFIQKNFFSGPGQIALVMDPLSGAVAICVNTPDGIEYLPRFWVDGREQLCRVPGKNSSDSPQASAANPENSASLEALETKVNQLLQALDEQRRSYSLFLMSVGIIFCLAIVASVGYFVFHLYANRNEPPKLNQYVPVPVQIGDKTVLLGVGIAEWNVPPELNSILLQMEKQKKEAEEKAAKEADKQSGENDATPPSTKSTQPASKK